MGDRYQEWLKSFLEREPRSLNIPDGRPLYSYQCGTEEFSEVESLLSKARIEIQTCAVEFIHYANPGLERLFVLYCAEWWRRYYKSGAWKWQPIFGALSWPELDHKSRTQLVQHGLRYWKRRLLPRGDRRGFLLTVACEGGLPVNLIHNDTGYLRAFLKAILRDFATYHRTGVDAAELAGNHLDYLPRTLRQEMVQEIAGKLVESIWELQNKLSQHSDPVQELDRGEPNWRTQLPMVLEDKAADALVSALLQQARKIRSGKETRFQLVRRLIRIEQGWQLQAELQLPDVIDQDWLIKELRHAGSLGERLELRLSWSEKNVGAASLVKQNTGYNVYPNRRKLHIRESAHSEISCFVYERGRQVGHLPLPNGSGLTEELPLIFVDREGDAQALELWAQGSCSSRFPEVFALSQIRPEPLSPSSEHNEIELVAESLKALGREMCLYRLSGKFGIRLDEGMRCGIRTQQAEETRSEYRFEGKRNYLVETKLPVFMGLPLVRRVQERGAVTNVRSEELTWSMVTGKRKWQSVSQSPNGLIELRHVQDDGECLFARRVIVLPMEAQIHLLPGDKQNEGRIELRGVETDLVAWECHDSVEIVKTVDDEAITLHCTAEKAISGKILLRLRWHNGCECDFEVPYPAEGARFVAPDRRILTMSDYVALENLFGYSATAISLRGNKNFKILGSLKGADIESRVNQALRFEVLLSEVKGNLNVYELPLYELHQPLKRLFSLSADKDAVVTLELLQGGSPKARIDVQQFIGRLEFDRELRTIRAEHCEGLSKSDLVNAKLELLPLADPDAKSCELHPQGEQLLGWDLSEETLTNGPWLAVAPVKARRRYRPRLVAKESQSIDQLTYVSGLSEIIGEPVRTKRIPALNHLFKRMSQDIECQEWQVLLSYVRRFAEVHPDCLDWVGVAVEHPEILIGLLLLGGSVVFETVYEWQDYLPFKWWMLPVRCWHDVIRKHLACYDTEPEVRHILTDEIKKVLCKLSEREDGFGCGYEFLTFMLTGTLEAGAIKDVCTRGIDKSWTQLKRCLLPQLVRTKADLTWPTGLDRDYWCDFINANDLSYLRWFPVNSGFQRPVVDAPLAAAYFSIKGQYLKHSERSFLTVIRDFDSDWFDVAFRAVQAILLVQFTKEKSHE